jgi:hypothetical protein
MTIAAELREIEELLVEVDPKRARERLRELRLSIESDALPDTYEPEGDVSHA